MGKTAHKRFDCADGCTVERTLSLIGGKYKGTILYRLTCDKVLRFSQLLQLFDGISQKTLTAQLRALEKDGLIFRTVYAEVPPRVDYSLTEKGQSLAPILRALKAWGDNQAA